MALALSDEHVALADVVRTFVRDQQVRAAARAATESTGDALPAFWAPLVEQGWLGLHLPEEHGGHGYGLPELAIVLEGLGLEAAPGPFLPTVLASAWIAQCGAPTTLLPALADGSAIAAVALAGRLTGAASGTWDAVLGAPYADQLVLAAGDDVLIVAAAAPGVTVHPQPGLDLSRPSGRVVLDGATEAVVVAGGARTLRELARVLTAAEAAGGAQACLEMARSYALQRTQFGRTIGTFQAVKHHLANMLADSEAAVATAWDAARAPQGTDQASLAAAVAASRALPAYQRVAQKAIQVLGGIGFTWEHDAHLFLRRAVSLNGLLQDAGDADADLLALYASGVRRVLAVDAPIEADEDRQRAQAFVKTYDELPEADRRAALVDSGYLMPHWPAPWGVGAGAAAQLVIEEELAGHVEIPDLGITGWVALTVTQHGTPEQLQRWIRQTLMGDLVWCQLFSEPEAGSDAANVKTKGVRVEGGWRVTGQKIWTSNAQNSQLGFATVRTDSSGKKHAGVTMMVIDMAAEGVEVRPLREITGEALFNEVFFDDVFVPDADVVGEVGGGWAVARATLGNERVTIGGSSEVSGFSEDDLVGLWSESSDPRYVADVGGVLADRQVMRMLNLRQATRAVQGSGPGPEGNLTKMLTAEHNQHVSELALKILGSAGVAAENQAAWTYLFHRCATIAGGTSEITRNQIAERLLGMPRDPLLA